MKFIIRWIITTAAVAAAVWLVPGITTVGGGDAIYALAVMGLALSVVDALVKPIVKVFSLPATILTLGLFLLVINAAMLLLASWLSTSIFGIGVEIDTFTSALIGAIIVSIVGTLFGLDKQTAN